MALSDQFEQMIHGAASEHLEGVVHPYAVETAEGFLNGGRFDRLMLGATPAFRRFIGCNLGHFVTNRVDGMLADGVSRIHYLSSLMFLYGWWCRGLARQGFLVIPEDNGRAAALAGDRDEQL
jgi:hypothetical protein